MTAHNTAADIQACQQAGMTMFVEKPVRRETLLNAILASLSGQDGAPGEGAIPGPVGVVPGARQVAR